MIVSGLRQGTELAGFRIESLIARGGMGLVYRATQLALTRDVALKFIAPELSSQPQFRERFMREARMAASLEHPHVLPVYEVGEVEGELYLAMRLVDGPSLAELLLSDGRLEPARAARLVSQLGGALDAAHRAGLVHRDVKPANVLLAAGTHAYLCDFGLSRRAAGGSLTKDGSFLGTAGYASPEQIRGEAIDARSDVYALGCLFYECLTGHQPFERDLELALMFAHLQETPPEPSDVDHSLTPFDSVCARAMAKEPDDRFASAGDLGRAAVAAVEGRRARLAERSVATGAAAPLGTVPRRRPRWRRRTLVGSLAWGSAAGALVVAGAFAIVFSTGVFAGGTSDNAAGGIAGSPIRLQQPPERLAAAGGYVWALTQESGRLTRIDPESRRAEYFPAPIDLGGGLFPDIAGGLGSLWLTHANASVGGVDRIAPASVEAVERIPLPSANALSVTQDAVWATTTPPAGATDKRGMLVRIDATDNRLVGSPIPVGRDPVDVAVGHAAVWVADRARDTVLRVDPQTLRIRARVRVGRGPTVLAVGPAAVWIANAADRTLSRVDPARDEVVGAPLAVGKEIDDLLATDDALWMAAADGTVTRLDLRTGELIGSPIAVGRAPLALAWDTDQLWVASASDQTLQAIKSGM